MLTIFGILIIITSIILGLIVLIQNPKGGGLSASFGGVGNQLMGVKQTNDVLEKGTWVFAAVVAILCVVSPAFTPKDGSKGDDLLNDAPTQQRSAPAPAQNPVNNNVGTMPPPAVGDSN